MKLETIAAAALLSLSMRASASMPASPDFGAALQSIAAFKAQAAAQKDAAPAAIEALKAPVPDMGRYQVRGADISHYQGDIDWAKVQTSGLSFVYMKAYEGTDHPDDKFAENWKGAQTAGLAKGAYQFYDFCQKAKPQAAAFVKTVPYEAESLPPVIDLEQSGSCKKLPKKAKFLKDFAVMVKMFKTAYHKTPILYMPYSIYNGYFKDGKDDYKFWIVDQKTAPQLPDGKQWTLWQYDWYGKVPGMSGDVDLDVFNGTPQMLASLEGDASARAVLLASR